MITKHCLSVAGALALGICTGHTAINWIGGSSTDFWDTANWDFTGSTWTAGTFLPLTPITDDIFMANAIGIRVTSGQGIRIGNGFSLNLNASDLYVDGTAASSGINGVDDEPSVNPSVGVYSYLFLNNNSYVNTQFTSLGMNVNVDASSHMQYRGSGDPINGQSERSIVNLVTGARLTLPTVEEFWEQATTQNSDILINGISYGANTSLLSFSGTGPFTGTAVIPEPSAALLGAFGLLCVLGCRRK